VAPESPLTFRPAVETDARAIRSIVLRAGINPRDLDWPRFLVAVDAAGKVVACGQVKPHGDGSLELASIAVRPRLHGRGIGSEIVRRLMESHGPPLWLMCRSLQTGFYRRLGFETVDDGSVMPTFFRRVHRLARLADPMFPQEHRLAVMTWQGGDTALRPPQPSA
jgi:N-acetylglutamate synthase-like GNAT family acetyltransferase